MNIPIKFWSEYFEVYDYLNLLPTYRDLLKDVSNALEIKKGELILEAGCGTGNLALEIQKRGGSVIGIDSSIEALNLYKKKDPQANTILADLNQKLPFADAYFDKIAINNTLYAFPPQRQKTILGELKRVLKSGGILVVSNPKKGWQPLKIYLAGVKQNIKREGIGKTFKLLITLLIPTIKILYYNVKIRGSSSYSFLSPQEQYQMIKDTGFSKVSISKSVYGGQGILNQATK